MTTAEARQRVADVRDLINAHIEQFYRLVALTEELGYSEDDGLQGSMRDIAHEVEAKLRTVHAGHVHTPLMFELIMMRRHEKDFIMRGDEEYIERLDKQHEVFVNLLSSMGMTRAEQQDLARLIGDYRANFIAYATAYKARTNVQSGLSTIYAETEPHIGVLFSYAAKSQVAALEAEAALGRARGHGHLPAIAVGGAILLLFASFAATLALSISRPITKLTGVMMALANGDKSVSIPATADKDEIGDMASAVVVFKNYMIEAERLAAARLADSKRKEEQLEQVMQSRTRFFAAANHDLRQPRHTISLHISMLEEHVDCPEARELIGVVGKARDSMGSLLDSLLSISMLDAGVIKPWLGPVAALDILEQLAAEFAPQAAAKSLELRVVPASCWVTSDPALLLRILRNLLSNAIRYTQRGKILLGIRRRSTALRFEVWDTGIGIPDDMHEQIFEEFYQADNPERDRDRGLGLGLAITDRLAVLMRHRIDVRSWPGKGSMFSLHLLPAVAPRVREKPEEAATDLAGVFVVLVEDNLAVLKGTERVLVRWGCEVIAADSAAAAVAAVETSERVPDLILAHLRLRENETGIQAIERIRDAVQSPVPAMIVTGDTDPDRLREAAASGHLLLHKPLVPARLRAAMESLLAPGAMHAEQDGLKYAIH